MKSTRIYLPVLFLLVLIAASCGNRKQTVDVSDNWYGELPDTTVLIRYQRTPCFGACPVFDFVMYASGKAEYNGKNFVEREGLFKGKIDPARYAEVLAVADSIRYYDMDERYDNKMVTDLPSISTTLLLKSGPKDVLNRYQGPKSLNALYLVLDRLVDEASWNQVRSNQ